MTKQEAKARIDKLKKEINRHRYLYHVLDRQEISEAALDSLKHELYQLEQQYPELITPDSPTQRVGGQPLDKFVKVRHSMPMLSLEDVFSPEELEAWQERIQKLVSTSPNLAEQNLGRGGQKLEYFAELKVDGFAVALVYRDGIFIQGATRGDGQIGEEVTQNLKTIESIPLKLELHLEDCREFAQLTPEIRERLWQVIQRGEIEIRGEVYMTKQAFAKVNQERKKQGLPLYANPRNTAAGSIRQLDPKIAASRELNFLAYDLVTDLGQQTHQQEHQIIQALGFKTDQGQVCRNLKEVVEFWQKTQKQRDRLSFQIDGLVVTVNHNKIYQKLGLVGKAPRGSIAFKFPAKEATSLIEDIVVQVGRTGALTPVAHLKPVQLGGTTISRATLHNEDEIKRLDVRIGDTVIIQRAGDVIPEVVGVLKGMRSGRQRKFQMPRKCPVCGSKIVKPEGQAIHRCPNKKCSAQQRERIKHFVSKKGFDINGLGPKIINQLMDEGLISDPADIFSLTEGDLIPLERFGEKSAANLVEAIAKSKKIPLAKFIYALGIRHIGEETAQLLAAEIKNQEGHHPHLPKIKIKELLNYFQKLSLEDLQHIQDIGPVVGKSIYDWFRDKRNLKLLQELDKAGLQIQIPKLKTFTPKLQDKTFVLTGQLESMTREEAKAKIRALGGDVSSSVAKTTDFVVVGQKPGSKYDKAKKLGVKIIKEREFLEMIKS